MYNTIILYTSNSVKLGYLISFASYMDTIYHNYRWFTQTIKKFSVNHEQLLRDTTIIVAD